jgi:hypothetical protein
MAEESLHIGQQWAGPVVPLPGDKRYQLSLPFLYGDRSHAADDGSPAYASTWTKAR